MKRMRALITGAVAALAQAALSAGAVLAQRYELPQDNPFAPSGGQQVVELSGGVGAVLVNLASWLFRSLLGPALLVVGAYYLIKESMEVYKNGLHGHTLKLLGIALGMLIVLVVMSGRWYEIIQSVWNSLPANLSQ